MAIADDESKFIAYVQSHSIGAAGAFSTLVAGLSIPVLMPDSPAFAFLLLSTIPVAWVLALRKPVVDRWGRRSHMALLGVAFSMVMAAGVWALIAPGEARATRTLSLRQRALIESGKPSHEVCRLSVQFTSTTETERYAVGIGKALGKAGWPLIWYRFLNYEDLRMTDAQQPIAIVANPDDKAGADLQDVLRRAGIDATLIPSTAVERCNPRLQIDDVG